MKVALFYAHAASNWGDLAINKGVVNLLKRIQLDLGHVYAARLPHNMIHSLNSDISLEHLKVIPVEVPAETTGKTGSLAQAYDYLTDIDSYISDFGLDTVDTVMLNSGEHLYEAADGSNHADLAWRFLPFIAAVHAGVPTVQLPATFGPFYTHRVTRLVQFFLTNVAMGAVRDELSQPIVANFGRPLPQILDPGFFGVDSFPQEAISGNGSIALIPRLEDFGLRAGSRRSAYVLAKNRGTRYEESKAFQVYLDLASGILSTSSDSIHLIIQTWADRELIQALYAALSSSGYADRVWLHDPTDYVTFTECLGSMDLVVTSRFHAAILALTQAVPAVGVYSDSHGHKMPGLFSLLGAPQCAIRMQDRLKEEVVRDIRSAIEFSRDNRGRMYDTVSSWRERSEEWFTDIMATYTGSDKPKTSGNLQEVDQMRLDLVHMLHHRILGRERDEDYQKLLKQLKKIDDRLSSKN